MNSRLTKFDWIRLHKTKRVLRKLFLWQYARMEKDEVIQHLRELFSGLKEGKYLTLKDLKKVPRLSHYMYFHFRNLGKALKAAQLPGSKLASAMKISDEDLLNYLRDLKAKLYRNPRVFDFTDDNELYKKYSEHKITWSIYKSRFGGLREAIKLIDDNPNLASKKTRNIIGSNNRNEKNEFIGMKGRFWGQAAEIHVTAELLYRGFQAANIPVDFGLDILAVKDNTTYYFQVKHKDISTNQPIKITKSSFENTGRGSVYYVFVLLSNDKREFLIIPYHIVQDWIHESYAKASEEGYLLYLSQKEGRYYLKEKNLDHYLNNWGQIK